MEVKVPNYNKEKGVVFDYILNTIKDIELNNTLYKYEYWDKLNKANKNIIESNSVSISDLDNAFMILSSVFGFEMVINSYKYNTALKYFKTITSTDKTNLKRLEFAKNIESIGRNYYKFRENNFVNVKNTRSDVAMTECMYICENVQNLKTVKAYEERFENAVKESTKLTNMSAPKTNSVKVGEKSK